MSNNKKITRAEAIAEVRRRKAPKGSAQRMAYPRREVMSLGGAELEMLAGITAKREREAKVTQAPTQVPTPAPAKPAKPARTELQKLHTELRKQAFAWRLAEYHAGRKHTMAAAYAKFGTAKAEITNAPEFQG